MNPQENDNPVSVEKIGAYPTKTLPPVILQSSGTSGLVVLHANSLHPASDLTMVGNFSNANVSATSSTDVELHTTLPHQAADPTAVESISITDVTATSFTEQENSQK